MLHKPFEWKTWIHKLRKRAKNQPARQTHPTTTQFMQNLTANLESRTDSIQTIHMNYPLHAPPDFSSFTITPAK